MNEEKLRTLLILNNRWPRSVIDYNVVGDRVEVIDPQRKVLTVLSIAELERMKLEYQRGLDRMRKGVFDTSIVDLLVDYTDKVRATGSDNPAWNLLRDTILSMIGGIGGIVRS